MHAQSTDSRAFIYCPGVTERSLRAHFSSILDHEEDRVLDVYITNKQR
jgi:hypothetical protein